nr:GTP-binding protein [Klebsiella pneumoniae]
MKRTPLIILNGFLGAGKTTLLKNLLTQAHKRRMTVSVIVNDMSELDVDGVLIANTEIVDAASNNFVSISADSISSRSGIQKLDSALKTCSKHGLRILFYWKRQAAAILFPGPLSAGTHL